MLWERFLKVAIWRSLLQGPGGLHYPLGVLELADDADVHEFRLLFDDLADVLARARFHGVPGGLGFPGGDGQEHLGVADLAVQPRAPGARSALDDLAGADPGLGVLFGAVAWVNVNLEDEMHDGLHSDGLPHGARWQGADLLLSVRVVPRAAADAVVPEADHVRVRITAPPVEGKANRHLCKVLGGLFGVAKSRVLVEKGAGARHKTVRVVAPARLPAFLEAR